MAIIDEIKNMQTGGKSDQDITLLLQQKGYGIKEVSDALAQTKIKQAVSDYSPDENTSMVGSYSGGQDMQQSMASQPSVQEVPEQEQTQPQPPQQQEDQYAQAQQQAYAQAQESAQQQAYASPDSAQYAQQYNPYEPNNDAISDIAEQIVAEKLTSIRKQLENAIALKTTTEARLLSLDERLKRLEKIIDRLQLSILQKVGEYMTNVEDIKREMIETQKSFKSLLNQQDKD